jgi:hypothetical protein
VTAPLIIIPRHAASVSPPAAAYAIAIDNFCCGIAKVGSFVEEETVSENKGERGNVSLLCVAYTRRIEITAPSPTARPLSTGTK